MNNADSRERGIALLAVAFVMVAMFGATAAVVMVVTGRSQAMTGHANDIGAFYLAEAGIEAGKYEIGKTIDAAGDGVGNVTTTTADGTIDVAAQDLGGGVWKLSSIGSYGGHNTTIEATVGRSKQSKFPGGAATFVGEYDAASFTLSPGASIVIDGGEMPAFTTSSSSFYEKLGTEFATAIDQGHLLPEDIVGTGSNLFEPSGSGDPVELPIEQYDSYAESLEDLSDLHEAAIANVYDNVIPGADYEVPGGHHVNDDLVYGTADTPVTAYLSSSLAFHRGSLSGYGTLVINDSLTLPSGSALNWHGDVILLGDDSSHAAVDVRGGTFDVTGSLTILGAGGTQHVSLDVGTGGSATIDGSLLMSTSFADTGTSRATVSVVNGSLDINGVFTMLGRQVTMDFLTGSDVSIHGMWQGASPPADTEPGRDQVRLNVLGDLEMVYDMPLIEQGFTELMDFAEGYNIPQIETGLFSEEMEFYAWHTKAN